MVKPSDPATIHLAGRREARMNDLVARVADHDRLAFRSLYTMLALRVWRCAVGQLPPADARAVTRSTFVEIWHLAGHHPDPQGHETWAWILSIIARRVDDRTRSGDGQPLDGTGHDEHTLLELTALLGNGDAPIRAAAAGLTLAGRTCGRGPGTARS
ncbi:hypothetical protein [Spirilliplanes yamanashiensis]|nr:hypothetical protein [Spirilliplanes yamanashiensis]